jgi:hypothetical protein
MGLPKGRMLRMGNVALIRWGREGVHALCRLSCEIEMHALRGAALTGEILTAAIVVFG